jgi:hypothetical protein
MDIEVNLNELKDYSPEGISQTIFHNEPNAPFSYQIIAEQDQANLTYIFEILIIILLEGLEILTGDLSQANLSNFNKDHLTILNPWFRSLGFDINVNTYDEKDKESYNKYYCRVLFNDKLNKMLFKIQNIDKNYHFLVNGNTLEENENKINLNELYGILSLNGITYCISFNFLQPINNSDISKN